VIFYTGPWEEEGESEESSSGSFLSSNSVNGQSGSSRSSKMLVNITGGPLSYRYQFHEIHIHYGLRDDGGSEHTVDGYAFPAEVNKQILIFLFLVMYMQYVMGVRSDNIWTFIWTFF